MKTISKCIIFGIIISFSSVVLADDKTMKDSMMKKSCDEMMAKADMNNDGKLSKEEFIAEKTKMFTKYDKDSDGMLSKDEHEMMGMDMHKMMMGEKGMSK